MDKIYVNKMAFYGYHGLFPEENKLGQRFYVDAILELDLRKAGRSDKMEDSIHYGEVYELTKRIVEGEALNLVETLTETIAQALLGHFSLLEACTIKVTKPDPPIPGHYDSVAVEVYRERSK
ncbi:dihydroneopterin aldolase (plasmid) [Radiobacillus kanasensis]|uniref:dihydroneopterin aldolase n=1 Tax=Radiobacillus kanasensis TaxID=2844358 RepID=UPI001E5BE6ED|nr:dihydroneopterin aldolase [Radiobacillus kanasensis]UFU01495.1 dihydroneopterin aldolase [Radiobacillus kanasensis]